MAIVAEREKARERETVEGSSSRLCVAYLVCGLCYGLGYAFLTPKKKNSIFFCFFNLVLFPGKNLISR